MSSSPLTTAQVMPGALATGTANGASVPFSDTGFASTSFLIICSALVMIMTPAVGLLYAGLSRSKNSLSIFLISFISYAVVTIQWVLLGFSLCFSETGSLFLGNLTFGGFLNVSWQALPLTAPAVSAVVFALYQLQFATVTMSIVFGSVIERIRIFPSILFMVLWTTLIYDPVAYWTWGARGWIKNMSCLSTAASSVTPCQVGGLDFAGGGPVHMASGAAALAFCLFLGKRRKFNGEHEFPAHNITNVIVGTALLWLGWFGFNAGSATAATPRAGYAGLVTTVAASSGAFAWTLFHYARTRKWSALAFCAGALAGLVGITPAAGYVNAWSSIVIGILTAAACYLACRLKERTGAFDDATDTFGVHGVGGFVGSLCTGLFASKQIALLDGTVIAGGALIDGSWSLLGYNVVGSLAILVYAFGGTMVLLCALHWIPGCQLRLSEDYERLGGDAAEMGEAAYIIDTADPPAHAHAHAHNHVSGIAIKDADNTVFPETSVDTSKNVQLSNHHQEHLSGTHAAATVVTVGTDTDAVATSAVATGTDAVATTAVASGTDPIITTTTATGASLPNIAQK